MMKKSVLFLVLVTLNLSMVTAQLNEAGIFAGGSNFIGDVGKTNYISPNSLAIGVIYKRNLTHRYAVRATYTYSKIQGDDTKSGNSFKEYRGLSFENALHELAVGFEFNFFEYNVASRTHYRTPYIFMEAAVNNYSELYYYDEPIDPTKPDSSFKARESVRNFNYTIPIGIGYKGRLWKSLGFSIETSFRYTFKDDLDGYYNGTYYPYKIPETKDVVPVEINDSNGNDWYVFTGFTIVYVFDKNSRSWERLWERNQ